MTSYSHPLAAPSPGLAPIGEARAGPVNPANSSALNRTSARLTTPRETQRTAAGVWPGDGDNTSFPPGAVDRLQPDQPAIQTSLRQPGDQVTTEVGPEPVNGADLILEGVGHTYRVAGAPSVEALTPIDLTVRAGEFVALVGHSGCGKTTLLEIVAGLRPPSCGRVLLGGAEVIGPGRRRGVVFQQSSSLLPWRTVAGNVALGLELAHVPKRERAVRVARELERVGLQDFADRKVYELSGGMQQRTQIARALVADPEVLLLDEPFSALDTFTRELLQEQLRMIWKEEAKTVLFVTHSVEEATLLATRVVLFSPRPGRVIFDHPIDFTCRDVSLAELRADPAVVAFAAQLRCAIGDQQV